MSVVLKEDTCSNPQPGTYLEAEGTRLPHGPPDSRAARSPGGGVDPETMGRR